jgi:hypothetical protein
LTAVFGEVQGGTKAASVSRCGESGVSGAA